MLSHYLYTALAEEMRLFPKKIATKSPGHAEGSIPQHHTTGHGLLDRLSNLPGLEKLGDLLFLGIRIMNKLRRCPVVCIYLDK